MAEEEAAQRRSSVGAWAAEAPAIRHSDRHSLLWETSMREDNCTKVKSEGAENVPNSMTFLTLCQQQAQTVRGGRGRVGSNMISSTEDTWVGVEEEGICQPDLGKNF